MYGSLLPFLAPIPTGRRGEPLLSEDEALEQLLMRNDEAWKQWVVETYDPDEGRGNVSDVLWARVQAAAETWGDDATE